MILYYLLLLALPFHADPRVGVVLLRTSFLVVTPVKILGVLAVAAAVLSSKRRDAGSRVGRSLIVPFALFVTIPPLATLASGQPTPSDTISQMISGSLLFAATQMWVTTEQRLRQVVRILVLAFAFGSLWTYKEHFIDHAAQSFGLEGESNYEALMLLPAIALSFWVASFEVTAMRRRVGVGCALLLIGALVLTESRGGILAGLVMALMAILRGRHKLPRLLLLAAAAVLILTLGPANLLTRFSRIKLIGAPQNGDEQSTRLHVELLKAGFSMIEDHPLLGVGLERFKPLAAIYNPEIVRISGRSYVAHDTFLQIGAECGVPVLLLFVWMVLFARRNFRRLQRSEDPALAALSIAMEAALVGVSFAALSISVELLPFWLLIFLSISMRRVAAAEARVPVPSRSPLQDRNFAAILRDSRDPSAGTLRIQTQ